MKKYISAIIIPCFLLQLFGCYSSREMSLEELKKYEGPDDIVIKTNQDEMIINRKSSGVSKVNWKANDSSITVEKQN